VDSVFRLAPFEKSLMVTQVDQTWKSVIQNLEQIDATLDELMLDEEQ